VAVALGQVLELGDEVGPRSLLRLPPMPEFEQPRRT
jgi:hypothetical protein